MDRIDRDRLHLALIAVMVALALVAILRATGEPASQQGAVAAGAESVTIVGAVFADKDADGVRDRNENGIADVSVSDGATIVQTDDSGRYSLPFDPERRRTDLVWVTVPSGYDVPTNANRTPQFYRELRGLVAGEERQQDFALQRSKQTARENFSFTALADVHVRPDPTYTNNGARFAAQLQQVNQVTGSPSFTLIAGDLLLDARDAEFEEYLAAQSTSKLPVYTAVGNHDIAFYAGPDYRDRIDPYRRYLGPEWYSFDYGQRHFVMLEDWLGFAEQPEQLEWLRQDLRLNARDDREVVVVTHVQLNAPDTREVRTAEYIKLLEEYNTKLVLMGHTHVNDVIASAQNVNTNSSGSNDNDFTPPGYRHVQFKDGRVLYPYKMFGVHRSLTLVNPAPGTEVSQARGELQVNAYNTASQVEGVQYSIDGAAERKLQQTSAFTWADPRWDARALPRGEHTIRVRATDDAGRTWQESATFRVGESDAVARPMEGADWPQFHGNERHTGRALDALAPQLRLAWSHRSPGSIMTSSPAVKDGAVYIGVRDEDGVSKNGLLAVDLATGRRLWKFTTQSQVQTSPAVQDGVVFAAEVRGTLYGIDARTGQELWRRVTAVEADGVQRGRMYTPPAVANGVVYQGYSTRAGTRLMALDGRTGREIWNVALENDQFVAATPIIEEGRLYVLGGSRYMIALDAATGQQIWRQRPTLSNWSHSVPSFANGRIFTAFRTGVVVAMDARDGSTLWTYQDPESASYTTRLVNEQVVPSATAVANGLVYVGLPDGTVNAFRAATGRKVWEFQTEGGVMSSATLSGSTLFVGSNDGKLYALDPDTGKQQWSYEIGAWVASSPAVTGNTLVVGAFDGNLYAFTGSPGEERPAGVEVEGASADTMVGGQPNPLKVRIYNDTDAAVAVTATAEAPSGWSAESAAATLAPNSASTVVVPVTPPALAAPGTETVRVRVGAGSARVYGSPDEAQVPVVPSGNAVPLALDSGDPDSPVLNTYDRLSPLDTFIEARGYGWASAIPLSRYRGAPDALRGDFTLNRAPATTTLRVNVPAGRHRVYVLTGDAASDSGRTSVRVDGQEVGNSGNDVIAAGQFRWFNFELDGGDTGRTADLEISGSLRDGFWRVNAVVMMP